MTTDHHDRRPPPRASGASATERFTQPTSRRTTPSRTSPPERVDTLAREVLEAVYATVRKHKVTYDEFNALKAWLIGVGRGRRVAAVPRRVGRARRRGGRHRAPRGQQGLHRGALLRPGRARAGRRAAPSRCARTRAAPRSMWTGHVTSTDGSAARRAPRSRSGTPTTTASTPSSPPASRSGTCAAPSPPTTDGALRDPHDAARAVPDPHRRLLRQAHRRGRLARLAPGPPARQGLGARPRAAHRAALLPRRRAQRRRHRLGGQARADPRPAARSADGCGATVAYGFVLDPAKG